ncbi:MAG: isoprenylcysteine carboxylmethyltransferase family protein [Candidatus Tumulicola sp.]
MPGYLGVSAIVLLISIVLVRVRILNQRGIVAMKFGIIDKTDFLIPPFAFLYFYLVFAGAFNWLTFAGKDLFASVPLQWLGVTLCASGLFLMVLSLVAFGSSFRVGIDTEHPNALITSGVFAFTRNPMYVAFGCVLFGEFLIQPRWLLLVYLVAGSVLFHRQVLREEAYLQQHYGPEYTAYRARVRRYL